MLKKEYRLKKNYQFNYVYRVGQAVHGRYLLVLYTKSKNKNVKIGIAVTKKVGKAVVRNRARRLIREAVTPFAQNLNPNFNLVIIAKQSINNKKMNVVKQDLEIVLKKANLL